jgi:integrase
MASYRKRGKVWRAELYREGQRESASFPSKAEAVAWATQREHELIGGKLPDKSLKDALRRYSTDVSPTHRGERWEVARLGLLERDKIAHTRLEKLKASDLSAWRDRRLESVSGASVAREMNLLKSVLETARKEWGWLRINPLLDVGRPSSPASRKRRISQNEIDRLKAGFGLSEGDASDTATQRTGLAFLFALETAMRAGEILGLKWDHVRPKSVMLPQTKNGDSREVPLTSRARQIIAHLPQTSASVFNLDPQIRDALFRRVRNRCEIVDLHFHDSRAEAIWRLSKKLDVMELARMIGHRDLRSLMLYYATSVDELADQLG